MHVQHGLSDDRAHVIRYRFRRHQIERLRARPPKRVLLIATRQIGDVLLTTPLAQRLRRLWPDAEIDLLGFAETLGVLEGNPDIDRLLALPSRGGTAGLLRFAKAARLWRRYDLALVTEQNDRAHLLGFIAAPVRTGIVAPELGTSWWKRALLAHHVVRSGDDGNVHVVDEKLAMLAPWVDAAPEPSAGDVVTPASSLPEAFPLTLRDPFVVLQIPSMWRYKQWPIEHYGTVAAALIAAGMRVVLTGGNSAEDRAKVSEVARSLASEWVVDACGRLDFRQLTALLTRAALYIGPDTSVTHLAAATGVRTVALFGPTNPVRWGPRGPGGSSSVPWQRVAASQRRGNVTLLQGSAGCVPCGRAGCDDHRQSRSACLEDISAARVIAAAFEILRTQPAESSSMPRRSGAVPELNF